MHRAWENVGRPHRLPGFVIKMGRTVRDNRMDDSDAGGKSVQISGEYETGDEFVDRQKTQRMRAKQAVVELLRADHPSLAVPGPVLRKATTATIKVETPSTASA